MYITEMERADSASCWMLHREQNPKSTLAMSPTTRLFRCGLGSHQSKPWSILLLSNISHNTQRLRGTSRRSKPSCTNLDGPSATTSFLSTSARRWPSWSLTRNHPSFPMTWSTFSSIPSPHSFLTSSLLQDGNPFQLVARDNGLGSVFVRVPMKSNQYYAFIDVMTSIFVFVFSKSDTISRVHRMNQPVLSLPRRRRMRWVVLGLPSTFHIDWYSRTTTTYWT